MTAEEAKAHFTKLAQENGLNKEQTEHLLQAVDNEKFRTSLSQGYKRHEEYSRGLDQLAAERERWKNWYEKEELPKYQMYTQSLDQLRRYQETYGNLEDNGGGDDGLNIPQGQRGYGNNGNYRRSAGLTKEELDRYVEEKLKQRDGAYVNLTKSAVRVSADYMKRFNETLDVDAVEKIALDKNITLEAAYKDYIAPKEQAAMEARHRDEIEKAKAEAVRDYQSRHSLPVDTKPREAHPFFDRKQPAQGVTEQEQDRGSREAFMQGWNNYAEEMNKQT